MQEIDTLRQEKQDKVKQVKDWANILLAILFVKSEPLSKNDILSKLNLLSDTELEQIISKVKEKIKEMPFFLHECADTYQLFTKPEYKDYIVLFRDKATATERLSNEALEVLAYIAYNQPVRKDDIDRVRGVDSEKVLRTLVNKGLIVGVVNENLQGHPVVYRTTDRFLSRFQLKSLMDLPPLRTVWRNDEKS